MTLGFGSTELEYFYQSGIPITTLHVDAHTELFDTENGGNDCNCVTKTSKDTVNVRVNDHATWLTLVAL